LSSYIPSSSITDPPSFPSQPPPISLLQIKRKNNAALKEAALSYRGARVDEDVGYEDDETDGSETDNDEPVRARTP